jgi:predicted ATP-dependent endonuclease of OLD family
MITELRLKLGSSAGQPPLTIEIEPSITIFVGPNNSGKSLLLRELFQFCLSGTINAVRLILDRLVFASESPRVAESDFKEAMVEPRSGDTVHEGHSLLELGSDRHQIPEAAYVTARTSPNDHLHLFADWYLKYLILNLDGPGRIGQNFTHANATLIKALEVNGV